MRMIWLPVVAAAYFYFNWQYFHLAKETSEMTELSRRMILASFAVNYLFFIICSILEFPLILNWILFAFLLLSETILYNKKRFRCALFSTLIGIILGLSVNIFCRSVISLLMNLPLMCFDNRSTAIDNLKEIPVFLGFLIAGIALHCFSIDDITQKTRLIIKYPKHQTFLLQIMTGMFVYLFLNLLLYSTPLNHAILKIWSIKSCLFCIGGFYIAFRYTRRVCELEEYRDKNRDILHEIRKRRKEEKRLLHKASLDALTGLYNRQYAREVIPAILKQGRFFTLCFLDLDGLKNVNDQYGHQEGDRYIQTVAKELLGGCRSGSDLLFRYGGDEFLILFMDMKIDKAEERVQMVHDRLKAIGSIQSYRFPISFSYGLVDSTPYDNWERMIEAADQKMYQQKQQKWNVERR